MNYDSAAETGRRVPHRNGRAGARARRGQRTAERAATLAAMVLAVLALGLAVLWFAVSLPALAWLFAASVVGFGSLVAAPWLAVAGVVRMLER
jgi:fatty acid desaturase